MRHLTTSLTLLTFLIPGAAFAQDAVTLEEEGTEAPAEAPAEEAPEEAAAPAEEPVELEEEAPPAAEPAAGGGATGGADLSASSTAGFQATGDTAAAPATADSPATADPPLSRRPSAARQFGPAGSDTWEMSYSGYFRAPMRIGISNNTGPQYIHEAGFDGDGNLINPEGRVPVHEYDETTQTWDIGALREKKLTLHRPVIPDDQYGSWQSTGHNKSDWAEMFFSVGNGTVSGTLAIQGFRFTDSAWKEDGAQFGIGQGWVEVDHDLGFENVKFNAKVGSHWARYGMAGVYDGGEYDTYLFGRTHTMGGTARVDLALSAFDIGFEGGFGAKQPDPKMFNRARFTTLGHGHVFLTFPAMEFSAHFLHTWSAQEVTYSYPNVLPGSGGCDFTIPGAQCTTAVDQVSPPNGTEQFGGVGGPTSNPADPDYLGTNGVFGPEYPNGTQTVVGVDARLDLGLLGYLYAGYSHQFLENGLVVDNAIESIHSFGGGMYNLGITDNYLESPYCTDAVPNESCSNGTGTVGTILAQYELGLGNFGIFPGNMDLKWKLYGMLNFVSVDDIEAARLDDIYGGVLADPTLNVAGYTMDDLRQDGTVKKKIGTDLEFFPLDFMSMGLRFDMLDPHSKLDKEGFSVLSPRITFRTKMVTHEQISLQYSRYFYTQRMCQDGDGNVASPAADPFTPGTTSIYNTRSSDTGFPLRLECTQPPPSPSPPSGFGSHVNSQEPGTRGAATLLPDENVVKLEASMWW